MRLRYWIRTALSNSGILLLCSCVYTVLMQIQDEEFVWSDLFLFFIIYTWTFGSFLAVAFNTSLYKQSLPIALSFGCTRGEALVGIQFYRLLPLCAIAAFSLILAPLYDPDFFPIMLTVLPAVCGAYLFLNSLGTAIGTLTVKFGNKGLLLLIPVFLVFSAGVAFIVMGMVSGSGFSADILLSPAIVWIILGIGVIAHGLSLIPEIKTVYHYNVKL